jgi:hypothetical protein
MTNAMECGKGAAIFEIAARFNHSCVPNAHFAWCDELGRETVYIVKDVGFNEVVSVVLLASCQTNAICDTGNYSLLL